MKRLVMDVKNSSKIDERNEYGYALLHLAVMCDKRDVVELLLRSGANPDVDIALGDIVVGDGYEFEPKHDLGCVALHFARSESMAKLLLGLSENGEETFWRATVDKSAANGETPFDRCVQRDDDGMAGFYLSHTEDFAVGDSHASKTFTSGCELVMKIVELEKSSLAENDGASLLAAHAFSDLLPEFAKRTRFTAIVQDMRVYSEKVGPADQEPRVYAVFTRLLYLERVHAINVGKLRRVARLREGPKPRKRNL